MKRRRKESRRRGTQHRPAPRPEQGVPARILAALREAGRPLSTDAVAARLDVRGSAGQARITAALDELLQSGAVVRNRRDEICLRERLPLVVGTVSAHRDGFGFVLPDDRSASVFLPPRQMSAVMHGDRVTVRQTGTDRKGRPEGVVVDVLERGTTEVVGRLHEEGGIAYVVPDNARITHRVLIPQANRLRARAGQIVLVHIVEQPSRNAQPLGHVTRVLGDAGAPGMETEIAIHSHGLPFEFPRAALSEARGFAATVPAAARRGREDLRSLELVTIDGEDARDFDDAVFCERVRGGFRLIVAIADVAHYVAPDAALDREAAERGTSVYFPNRVLPMLPETLSNGLCSLNPGVDRLAIACEMRVNERGKITRSRFFEAVIRSAARLTYTEVAAWLARQDAPPDAPVAQLAGRLDALYGVFVRLHEARRARGALEFDAPEVKARFDERGRIAAFVEQVRNDAHRLIEECMIAANVEAARFLERHRIPTLYRVHGQPEEDRLEQLRVFLAGFAITLPRDRPLEPRDLEAVLERVAGSEEARLIESVVVRSLPQAVYQPQNIGHFGLALGAYAHFTSPIRRYPDLTVHRGIRHVLRGGTAADFDPPAGGMEGLGQQCSLRERRADEATRDAMSWLKCEYMSSRIGEEYDALVTGVVDFGLFVQIRGIAVDGLVHVSALGADYFSRDESGYRLIGARSGRRFRLGDHLRVRLINVNIDERKIDFELAERSRERITRERSPQRRRR